MAETEYGCKHCRDEPLPVAQYECVVVDGVSKVRIGDKSLLICKGCLVEAELYCEIHGSCAILTNPNVLVPGAPTGKETALPICFGCLELAVLELKKQDRSDCIALLERRGVQEENLKLQQIGKFFFRRRRNQDTLALLGCAFHAYLMGTTVEGAVLEFTLDQ